MITKVQETKLFKAKGGETMQYDFSKLRDRIIKMFGKQEAFAKSLGMSPRSLSLKLNNERYFKPPEISRAIELLDLSPSDIPAYFFAT